MDPIESILNLVGDRKDGLKLCFSMLAGYPLAVIHRTLLYRFSPRIQHIFFIIFGCLLYLYNYGFAICHSIIFTLNAYLLTNFLGGTKLSVLLSHLLFLGHLLFAYWAVESDEYDITWTTPLCIMTLRYIGLVMDVYDGQKPKDKLKKEELKTVISNPPDLIEVAAFGYFFCGTFVGNLFTLSRFRSFVNGEFLDKNGDVRSSSLMPSLGRFIAGCFYAVIHLWGMYWIPTKYFNSSKFLEAPFLWRIFWTFLWFRLMMSRYLFCWLCTEGAAILCGIAYNGKNEVGEDRWDGVRDVHIIKWETGLDFQSVIDSFNIGTNTFAKNHLFKRLRGLNNRLFSHIITLMYLATWHGYHLGYFILFGLEFLSMIAQQQFYSLIDSMPSIKKTLSQSWMLPIKFIFGRVIINVTMSIGFLTFGLIKTRVWIMPLMSLYFLPHVFFLGIWPIFYFIITKIRKGVGEKKEL